MRFDADKEVSRLDKNMIVTDLLDYLFISERTIEEAILVIRKIYDIDLYKAYDILSKSDKWAMKIIDRSNIDRPFRRDFSRMIESGMVEIGINVIDGKLHLVDKRLRK